MTERPEPTEPMNPALRGATTDSSQSERDVSGLSGPKATDASERPKSKDIWDKIDVVGKLLGSILIPIGIAIAGFAVNIALQDRAAKQKTSEIAVTILQSRDPATPELRTWALGVFNNMLAEANQKLPAAAQKELDKNPLPSTVPTLGRPGPGGPPLGKYNADPGETTVSGVSAGAFMAVQLGIAFSSAISGVGVIAGGPFGCSQGSVLGAITSCMTGSGLDLGKLIRSADQLAAANSVDPLANLQNQKVFVFHGYKDDVISRKITDLTVEFYRHYMGDRYGNIFYQDSIGAGNGIATVDRGLPCGGTASPYIYACNYDQAGIMLQYFYGALRANTGRALQGKILTFDQGRYTVANPDAYNLGDTGYIYVPDSCARGELCRVHIALHGCRQDAGTISDFYVKKAGYNEWADDNHIIVLYPQSRAATYNPNACWDWWGFDSPAYGTHQSPQMSAIMAMLKVVTAGFTPQSPSSTTTAIAPADVKVIDISATGAALTWTAVGGAATYRIYRSPGGNNPFKAVGDVVGPSFGELGLTPATGYRWRVTAIKDGVESRPSSDIAARTLEAPVGQ